MALCIDTKTNQSFDTWQQACDHAAAMIKSGKVKEVQIYNTTRDYVYPFTVYRHSDNPLFACVGTPYKTLQII